MNTPAQLLIMKSKHEYKTHLITTRWTLSDRLSKFLELKDAPSLFSLLMKSVLFMVRNASKLKHKINMEPVRRFRIVVFPLKKRNLIIIAIFEIFTILFFSFWK